MSSQLSADDLVILLNDIFSALDVLVERHGLEKVKTIGDAYMVIGGVPVATLDHVERVADFALEWPARSRRSRLTARIRSVAVSGSTAARLSPV